MRHEPATPWRMFLSSSVPIRVRLGPAYVGVVRLANFPHGFADAVRMTTDSPLTPERRWGGAGRRYSGEAAIPKRPHQEGTIAPPHSQRRFVIDLWAWSIRSELRNGVGLSPVSVISRCEQVTPPNTLRIRQEQPHHFLRKPSSLGATMLSASAPLGA